MAFSPDGKRIVISSWNGSVMVWDLSSGKEVLRKHPGSGVRGVTFSPDGKSIACAGFGEVTIWDAQSGKTMLALEEQDMNDGACAAFSPDGKRIATGGYKRVTIWDTSSGQKTLTLEEHNNRVHSVAFSPDGDWLAAADVDGIVKVWAATTRGQEP